MKKLTSAVVAAIFAAQGAWSADLELTVFNPGDKSVFPVSSTLIVGPTEVALVDAQFQKNDAEAVVGLIKDSGKKLTTIYVSQSDPDYYFGLGVLKAAYPDAKIIATAATIQAIEASVKGKVAFWAPILGENAPTDMVVPEALDGTSFTVDGEKVEIVGAKGSDPARTFVWIPSIRTITGGVVLDDNEHVWSADTQTPESRQGWLATLDDIQAFDPVRIIPGHYVGAIADGLGSVDFTRTYLKAFEDEAAKAKDSGGLIAAMKALYPGLPGEKSLEISAKVIKGEMKWPQ